MQYAHDNKFRILNLTWSPIRGPEGNIEYLYHLTKDDNAEEVSGIDVRKLVEESHEAFLSCGE